MWQTLYADGVLRGCCSRRWRNTCHVADWMQAASFLNRVIGVWSHNPGKLPTNWKNISGKIPNSLRCQSVSLRVTLIKCLAQYTCIRVNLRQSRGKLFKQSDYTWRGGKNLSSQFSTSEAFSSSFHFLHTPFQNGNTDDRNHQYTNRSPSGIVTPQ
jgi:hypothetical protein